MIGSRFGRGFGRCQAVGPAGAREWVRAEVRQVLSSRFGLKKTYVFILCVFLNSVVSMEKLPILLGCGIAVVSSLSNRSCTSEHRFLYPNSLHPP